MKNYKFIAVLLAAALVSIYLHKDQEKDVLMAEKRAYCLGVQEKQFIEDGFVVSDNSYAECLESDDLFN